MCCLCDLYNQPRNSCTGAHALEIKIDVRGDDLVAQALKTFKEQRVVAIDAINHGLFSARKEFTTQTLPKRVDRPTPWTTRGLLVQKVKDAGSGDGVWLRVTPGKIYPKRVAREHWDKLVDGGRDRSRRWYTLAPPLRKNRYGNAPRANVVYKRYRITDDKRNNTKGLYRVTMEDGRQLLLRRGKRKNAKSHILAVRGERKWKPRVRDFRRLMAATTDRRILEKLRAAGWG